MYEQRDTSAPIKHHTDYGVEATGVQLKTYIEWSIALMYRSAKVSTALVNLQRALQQTVFSGMFQI